MFRKSLYQGAHLSWPRQGVCPVSGPVCVWECSVCGLDRSGDKGRSIEGNSEVLAE